MSGFNRVSRCRHGLFLYNVNDQHIGRALDLYGEWAETEVALLSALVTAGDVVVDVGANIGTHAVALAQAVGANGLVYALEPQRLVFQSLCANVALNSLTNVIALPLAVGDAPGTIQVPALDPHQPANFGGVSLGSGDDEVRVIRLDDLALARCRLIKMDIEQMERAALEGARDLIARTRPILYVENNDETRSPALLETLLSHGYAVFWHFSPFFRADNFSGNTDNVFGALVDANVIAVPPQLAPAMRSLTPIEGPRDTPNAALQRAQADRAHS